MVIAQRPSAVMSRCQHRLNFPEAGGDVFVRRGWGKEEQERGGADYHTGAKTACR